MALDDKLKEKFKQRQSEKTQKESSKGIVEKLLDIPQKVEQFSRNIQGKIYSDNIVGDVSEDNLAMMQLSQAGIPITPKTLEAAKIQYQPTVGRIGAIGKDPSAVKTISENLRKAAAGGSASRGDRGFGALKVIDTAIKPALKNLKKY